MKHGIRTDPTVLSSALPIARVHVGLDIEQGGALFGLGRFWPARNDPKFSPVYWVIMDLHRILKSQIFIALEEEGIPAREEDLGQFRLGLRKTSRLPWEDWHSFRQAASVDLKGAETFQQVACRVFHFGRQIGEAVGRLLSAPVASLHQGAQLVGTFNFGISYYDYLVDEYPEGLAQIRDVLDRDRLADWWRTDRPPPLDRYEPQLAFLWACIQYIFDEAKQRIAQRDVVFLSHEFEESLMTMFEAEHFIASQDLQSSDWDPAIAARLADKSALPFWAMTQIMLWGTEHAREAWYIWKEIGLAIGHLYALVDDAKDVWEDLKQQRWNMIVLEAVKRGMLEWPLTTSTNLLIGHLIHGLTYSSFVPQQVQEHCVRLRRNLEKLGLAKDRCTSFYQFLGASMAVWYG